MIIELLGPPAAGKTTLAPAVASALRQIGFEVNLITSSRPNEQSPSQRREASMSPPLYSALFSPLSRATKLVGAATTFLPKLHGERAALELLTLLPPQSLLWSIRYRRYLTLLTQSWNEARRSKKITIFDQGYLQALCSLCLVTKPVDSEVLVDGMKLIPRSDLVVHIDAPLEILESRLRNRIRELGPVERLFELDLHTNLKQIEVDQRVIEFLERTGRPITHVRCLDRRMLEDAASEISHRVAKMLDPARSHMESRICRT